MSDMVQREEQALTPDAEQERLGHRLREAREYLGFSQELVAERLGVPRASISAMENGKRKVSSLELKELAQLYRRPWKFFLGEEEPGQDDLPQDKTFNALFRTTKGLSEQDREQVLRFAQFLRHAGRPPTPPDERAE